MVNRRRSKHRSNKGGSTHFIQQMPPSPCQVFGSSNHRQEILGAKLCGERGWPRYGWGKEDTGQSKIAARCLAKSGSTQMGRKVLFSKLICNPMAAEKFCKVSLRASNCASSALRIIRVSSAYWRTGQGEFGVMGCWNVPSAAE